ncbi:hypothetical protein BDN70DRAFT_874473 [Pholiota conissans]|uniref:Uncharacterized protein n=1 Tax=Pholiota conissans TaxID=109636 RepID=A0A9P5ZAE3_9AGAR|nr:hypothetical protein BDN70DRAFT_874473 [Pholiota conissans]
MAAAAALSVNTPPEQPLEDNDTVSMSTVFHPGSQPQPDTVLSSSDGVLFYVHAPTIVTLFPSAFQQPGFAPISNPMFRETFIHLDGPSDELNIILHALYGTSPAAHYPSFETLISAVDRMPNYKISPKRLIRPTSPIYELLLSYAPLKPLDLYGLGAFHGIHSLCVSSSSHLLSYNLATISDQMAERIGAVYLKKLLLLHTERFDALKGILLHPPHPHPSTKECSFQDQRKLTRAWALVSAYLAWDARADLSTHTMKSTLNPLMENLTCSMCHRALEDRIKSVLGQWSSVKVSGYISRSHSFLTG